MRILIVTQYFWPEDFRINDIALELREHGHEVTVYTGVPNYPHGRFFAGYSAFRPSEQEFNGVKIIRAPLLPRGKGRGLRLALNFLSFALLASVLAPVRCRGSFDVILAYEPSPVTVGLPALVLKRLRRAPLLFWVQDLWPETLSATGAVRARWILALVARLVRFIYSGCDRILVQSRAFVEPVASLGVEPARILYLPNSAEALYRPMAVAADAAERASLPRGFRVVFAGNIGAAQDFETILAAAERLKSEPDIHWVIIGDGRMFSWVQEQVRERGLERSVHLLGRHPVESMPRFFALADVLLVTLKRDPVFALTVPSKVQSYLACARPILAALDGEGARVVTECGGGLAVATQDPQALAAAAHALYRTSQDERDAMGRRGRMYFEQHFDREVLLRRLVGWFEETIAERARCAS